MRKVIIKNASITFLSRILGFSRDILLARYIGVSIELDAFLIAFKLPNFFRRLLADGVFSQALLPSVVKAKHQKLFLQHVYAMLWFAIILVSAPFMLFPAKMLSYFIYGLDQGPTYILAVKLLPWVFPYLGCMACCGFYVVQLNINKQYEVGSVLPLALNTLLIAGIMIYGYKADILYVALAVLISGVLQVLYCMYRVYHMGGVLFPYVREEQQAFKGLIHQASFGFFAQIVTYFSSILDMLLVSFLPVGSLSWLYYGERLAFLPIGVISVIVANVVLTDLTQATKAGDTVKASEILQKASRWIMVTAFPAMVGGYFLAENIIALLFGAAHFGYTDIQSCAASFRVMAVAIPFLMMARVWNVVPYALSKPQHLLRITTTSFMLSASISILCLTRLQHVTIALGMLISGISNAYQLYHYIRKSLTLNIIDIGLAQHVLLSSMVMALVLKIENVMWPMLYNVSKLDLLYALTVKATIALGIWLLLMRLNTSWRLLLD